MAELRKKAEERNSKRSGGSTRVRAPLKRRTFFGRPRGCDRLAPRPEFASARFSGFGFRNLHVLTSLQKRSIMNLLLLRHADALPGHDDAARPLSDRGEDEAKRVGRFLDKIGF